MFSASQTNGPMDFLSTLSNRVTDYMNRELARNFTANEITAALKQMHPQKAPSPDSMPLIFFQKHWDLAGSSVTKALLGAFNSGQFPHALNHTHIVLIPVKKHLEKEAGYRPISLCNVMYKLISKLLLIDLKCIYLF